MLIYLWNLSKEFRQFKESFKGISVNVFGSSALFLRDGLCSYNFLSIGRYCACVFLFVCILTLTGFSPLIILCTWRHPLIRDSILSGVDVLGSLDVLDVLWWHRVQNILLFPFGWTHYMSERKDSWWTLNLNHTSGIT